MASHEHQWQVIHLKDGAIARVCLCGSFRVQFQAELPRPVDPWDQATLDLLEQEGIAEVKDS